MSYRLLDDDPVLAARVWAADWRAIEWHRRVMRSDPTREDPRLIRWRLAEYLRAKAEHEAVRIELGLPRCHLGSA